MADTQDPGNTSPPSAPLAAEFVGLPLDDIVATPLLAAVRAQSQAAKSTLEFIQGLADQTVKFQWAVQNGKNQVASTFSGPLLSMVPVPHLRIDALTTTFRYEINQLRKETKEQQAALKGEAKLGWLLSKFASFQLDGSLSGRSSEESTMNRSGSLEITVHASEAPMPEGLARILSCLASTIPTNAANTGAREQPSASASGTKANGN